MRTPADLGTLGVLVPALPADPAAINADRGPEVKTGRCVWPPLAGKPVAPTVDAPVSPNP